MQNQQYDKVPDHVERIGAEVVDAGLCVHRALGPGLLESVYEECLAHELSRRGLKVERQVFFPIQYEGYELSNKLRIDLLVEDEVVIELKAVEKMHPLYEAQLLTYLRLSKKRLGFLINFNVHLFREGIKRMVV